MVAEQGLGNQLMAHLLPTSRQAEQVTSAFPGTVPYDFQEKEELYNQYLRQVERQHQRGWQVRKGWVGEAVAGQPALFKVAATTREGDPLSGAEVEGQFLRPADKRLDQSFTMEEVAPGIYQTRVSLPAPGRWHLVLKLDRAGQRHEVRAITSVGAGEGKSTG